MTHLFLDTETRSPLQLSKVGTWAYAQEAIVLLVAYAQDEEAVKLWDCTVDPNMPEDLRQALEDSTVTVVAHNTAFDRVIVKECLEINVPSTRWLCTSVLCRANGLPASLKNACEALKMPSHMSKMEEGKALIARFSKGDVHVPAFDSSKPHHLRAWKLFGEYCVRDVEATRAIFKLLKPLSP
ncbi:DNA polymerase, partial [Liberibacter sp. Z1]|nr:DNA polymerase [Candidatus Liberibacter sp.]